MTSLLAVAPFLNPGLLALGAGLIAVPIVIHLLNRRRVQRRPWAAMSWLLAALKKHQRRLQLENWLILLLRILAVLLLGLALARPVLTDPNLADLLAGKRSMYVAVDTSYSMAARSEGRAVIDLAKAEADSILSSLGDDDTLSLVVTNDPRTAQSDGRAPFDLLPRTVGADGVAKAKEAVAALRTRDAPADWADTIARLRRQTAAEDVNRVVVIVTDFQATDWNEKQVRQALFDLVALPAAVRIIDVGGKERRNLTVAKVESALRRDAFVDQPVKLAITVENQGSKPVEGARVSVFLDGNPTPVRTHLLPTLPPVDEATGSPVAQPAEIVELSGQSFEDPGSHVLRVEVVPPAGDPGADALGLDSRRGFALRVRDRIRVLAWARKSETSHLDLPAAAYLRGVYERWELDDRGEPVKERSPLYELTTVPSETALADALARQGGPAVDLVVLANVVPRGRAIDALRDFVRGGGALVAFVGDHVHDPASINDPFHSDPEQRLLPFPYEAPEVRLAGQGQTPFRLDLETSSGHPLAEPFTGEAGQSWIALVPPKIWGRMTFKEDGVPPPPGTGDGPDDATSPAGQVVLRFAGKDGASGPPAVVAGTFGMGRTLWVATSIDHGWLEQSLFFLPVFLDEAAVLATRPDDARRNLEVGRRIVVTWLPRSATNARFVAPGGAEVAATRYEGLGESDRPTLVLDRVGTSGTWRLLYERETFTGRTERVAEHFAVNPEAEEGRLRRASDVDVIGELPLDSDVQILESWDDLEDTDTQVHQGEISVFVLWVVLGLLILESLLAWLFGRKKQSEGI